MNGATVVMGYCPMLIHILLVSWHDAQAPVTPA